MWPRQFEQMEEWEIKLYELLASDLPGFGEGVAEFFRLFAPGLGEVRFAAAAAANDGGDVADPIAGAVPLVHQIAGDASHEDDLSIPFGGGQEDGGGVDLFANLVDELTHQVGVRAGSFGH